MSNHFSLLSKIIASVFLILKFTADFESYHAVESLAIQGDISPSIIAGSVLIYEYILVTLISLIFSIVGFRRGNKYRRTGLVLNIIVFVYCFIPVGLILGIIN